jgi:hypothetical protein
MNSRTALALGSQLGAYRLDAVVGEGGMGVVYRATHVALAAEVALKVIAPHLAEDDEFRGRFKTESRLAAAVDHPHAITVHDAGEAGGLLYIAMDFVEGSDLRELIVAGALEPLQAATIVDQVAQALDAAHAVGLVHRDIKPGNVLVSKDGGRDHAYLTDFGLAKHVADSVAFTQTGHYVGTLDYMSPEQVEGKRIDARSDVYSLGCLLFHALSGRVPYPETGEAAKLYAHVRQPAPSLSELAPTLPAGFDAVIARAMAKNPPQRFPSAGDLGRAALAAAHQRPPAQPEHSVATGDAAPPTHVGAQPTVLEPRAGRRVLPLVALSALGLVGLAVGLAAMTGVLGGGDGARRGETVRSSRAPPVSESTQDRIREENRLAVGRCTDHNPFNTPGAEGTGRIVPCGDLNAYSKVTRKVERRSECSIASISGEEGTFCLRPTQRARDLRDLQNGRFPTPGGVPQP